MTKSKPTPGGSSWAPLLVAVGGSVGASLRWGGEELIPAMGGSITQAILVVNLLGAFMLGYLDRLVGFAASQMYAHLGLEPWTSRKTESK